MTSAARPTWAPAKGAEDQGGSKMFGPRMGVSSKDLPSNKVLKTRAEGQDDAVEVANRDLKRELLERETKHYKNKPDLLAAKQLKIQALEHTIEVPGRVDDEFGATRELLAAREQDEDFDFDGEDAKAAAGGRRWAEEEGGASAAGAAVDGSESESDDSDDSDDDDDDEAALLAELEKIKRERAEERERKQREDESEALESRREEVMRGNPLLAAEGGGGDFNVARRWDDDVVFRNQTRNEPKRQKRFINDTIRSDFHRRFLDKYMK